MPRTHLLCIGREGEVRNFWELPFAADGFDLWQNRLLLYRKAEASAQIYKF